MSRLTTKSPMNTDRSMHNLQPSSNSRTKWPSQQALLILWETKESVSNFQSADTQTRGTTARDKNRTYI
jgi:heme-degrading monooxygenase HmoA